MKILSIDLGLARTGIAICDPMEILASPLCVINETNEARLLKKIAELARENGAELIVVGHPKNMDGSEGERAKSCSEAAKTIENKSGIKTQLWDERVTTKSAHIALNATNTRGDKRKKVVDAVAAVMILESYLNYRKTQKG